MKRENVKKEYHEWDVFVLKYEGDPIREINEYGECTVQQADRCRICWFRTALQVKLALATALDKSSQHNEV